MIRKTHPHCLWNWHPHVLARVSVAVCTGLVLAALPTPQLSGALSYSQAFAQTISPENEALFLAVENNDLTAVRAAMKSGASVDARDFNGMQPVDLAIDRGFFDIAHYLISVRNDLKPVNKPASSSATRVEHPLKPTPANQSLGTSGVPAPAENVTVVKTPVVQVPVVDAPAPALDRAQGAPESQPPAQQTKALESAIRNAQTQTFNEVKPLDIKKMSATKKFVTTFFDFFKPPNTTGIMRKVRKLPTPPTDTLTADKLNQQLQDLETELGPALQVTGRKPSAAELAKSNASLIRDARKANALAKRKSKDAMASASPSPPKAAPFDATKPFNGQVDPDIVAYLDQITPPSGAATADPFALPNDNATPATNAEADPFALPSDSAAPATNAGVDPFAVPQDVSVLKVKKPPSRKAAAADPFDPFAAPPTTDKAASTDVLAGLLDSTDRSKAKTGWDVKSVEGATLPTEIQLLSTIEVTGNILEGVQLALGANTIVGQEVGAERLKLMEKDTIHRPCLKKGANETIFCVDKVSWPFEMEDNFLVDTIMYQGTSAVSRYDAGRATNYHVLFKSKSFAKVVNYYINRYGQPGQVVQRAVAPLAQPRMDNPTYIWHSREVGTDTITSLEIRKFDDDRGSFPDTRRGVIKLYRSHAGSIFPQLSQLELMVLKANNKAQTFKGANKPESVW